MKNKKKLFINDSYFLGDVFLTIYPHEKYNYTECKVVVDYSDYAHGMTSYIWHVDIDFLTKDCNKALEELKKDEYITKGSSETF